MELYEICYPLYDVQYDIQYNIEHTDDSGRHIKSNSWEEDPRNER